MGKVDFLGNRELAAAPDPGRRRRPFADPVHGEHGGLFKRGGVKGRRGVAEVMLGKEQLFESAEILIDRSKLFQQHILLKQLFAQPHRHGGAEGAEATRRKGQISLQQPLEFEERLVIKGDAVDTARRNAGVGQAPADRVHRKAGIVLLAAEAFLLRGIDDRTVPDDRGGAVVVISGDAEDNHPQPALRTTCR